MKITDLKGNEDNPRYIRDEKFQKLVKSIKEFPKMMELRPIVIDADGTVLGGNMRLKALQELKYKEVPDEWVKRADDLTDDEKRRFIIEDNVGFGEWDWDILANEWDEAKLEEWGLDTWQPTTDVNLDEFFEEDNESETAAKNKIVLEYSEEDFATVNGRFNSMDGSKEQIVWNLLGL